MAILSKLTIVLSRTNRRPVPIILCIYIYICREYSLIYIYRERFYYVEGIKEKHCNNTSLTTTTHKTFPLHGLGDFCRRFWRNSTALRTRATWTYASDSRALQTKRHAFIVLPEGRHCHHWTWPIVARINDIYIYTYKSRIASDLRNGKRNRLSTTSAQRRCIERSSAIAESKSCRSKIRLQTPNFTSPCYYYHHVHHWIAHGHGNPAQVTHSTPAEKLHRIPFHMSSSIM